MINEEDDEDSAGGESSGGGASGDIVFRLPNLLSQQRDDLLPQSEINRKIAVVEGLQKRLTEKQKERMKALKTLREGETLSNMYERGAKGEFGSGYGSSNQYKEHPVSRTAQFSGAENKVVGVPNLNQADTNEENKNKLENEYDYKLQNKLQYQNAPKKSYTPKLTR
jgi:hypothetical protein